MIVPLADDIDKAVRAKCVKYLDLYAVNISDALKTENFTRANYSIGQLLLILLVDVATEMGYVLFQPHLPLILHLICIHLDHVITNVFESSRILLINLIQSLSVSLPDLEAEARQRMDAVLAALNMNEGKRAWTYEDITPEKQTLESTTQLSSLTLELIDSFSMIHPNIVQVWGEMALKWACNCTVRHVACRSLQLVRILNPDFSQRMLSDLLLCLSANISDESNESQGFALELLETIYSMALQVERRLELFPQIFWCAVASLSSTNVYEIMKGMKIFKVYLDKIQSKSDEDTLILYFPTKWKGDFKGLLPIVVSGMYHAQTESLTIGIINSLIRLQNRQLIGDNAAMYATIVNMPRLLHGFLGKGKFTSDGFESISADEFEWCIETARYLSKCCQKSKQVSSLFQSYELKRFRSKADFLKQFVLAIRDSFPLLESNIIEILLMMLGNSSGWNVLQVLEILLVVFQDVASTAGKIRVVIEGNEWVKNLIALLESDNAAPQAALVLDMLLKGRIPSGDKNFPKIIQNTKVEKEKFSGENGQNTKFNMSGVVQTCGNGHEYISNSRSNEDFNYVLTSFVEYFQDQICVQ